LIKRENEIRILSLTREKLIKSKLFFYILMTTGFIFRGKKTIILLIL